ncbi:hypothetical protein SUDANB121_00349 [Nocardiopsis dassonvillei]
MREPVYYVAVSPGGRIAGPGGEFDNGAAVTEYARA